jgi:NAD(P)-dependent dehydrogenase (short-subunit alcohol dehydrogenase family)
MPSYLVTGASRGLGYAFVRHLAAIPGNTVIGMVRNRDATLARLEKDGITNVSIVQADITDREALSAAYNEAKDLTKGSLDILINNAALIDENSAYKTLLDDELAVLEEDLMASFRANVVGVANTVNLFLHLIRAGNEDCLYLNVYTPSVSGFKLV